MALLRVNVEEDGADVVAGYCSRVKLWETRFRLCEPHWCHGWGTTLREGAVVSVVGVTVNDVGEDVLLVGLAAAVAGASVESINWPVGASDLRYCWRIGQA